MAARIRLKRMGSKKQAFYRVVVSDARSPRDGRFIENIGYYNPLTEPSEISINEERLAYWVDKGVKVSEAVISLLRQKGIAPGAESAVAPEAVPAAALAVEEG